MKAIPAIKQERRWEIEDAIRIIKKYNEIVSDKELMSEAQSCMEKDLELIKKVAPKSTNGLVIKSLQDKIKQD